MGGGVATVGVVTITPMATLTPLWTVQCVSSPQHGWPQAMVTLCLAALSVQVCPTPPGLQHQGGHGH